jgi:hypothetical protein
MKAFRIAAIAAFLLVFAALVYAQVPNDPVIRTGGGHHSVPVTSVIFGVGSPSGNSPALSTVPDSTDCVLTQKGQTASVPGCFFKNNITTLRGKPRTISRLVFLVNNSEYTGTLTCGTDTTLGGPGPFAACTVQPVGDGSFSVVTFFNGSVPYGSDFSMGMRGFNSNTNFAAVALCGSDSSTAEIYGFPDARGKSDAHHALKAASRFFGCAACRGRNHSDFQSDQRVLGSGFPAGDSGSIIRMSVWTPSYRPNFDPSPITFDLLPTPGWRIT